MDAGPPKSSKFYWESAIFLVERELYKVPRWAFEKKSTVFANAFNLPRKNKEGWKPFVLPDVTKREFESLLGVLYPSDPLAGPELSGSEWESVLKLASKYRFTDIRVYAIKQLWAMDDPIQRIALGRKYGVPDWLRAGYLELIMRAETLEEADVERLGWKTAMRVFQLRERRLHILASEDDKESSSKETMKIVEEVFGNDIRSAEEKHGSYWAPDPEDIETSTLLCPTLDPSPVDLSSEMPYTSIVA